MKNIIKNILREQVVNTEDKKYFITSKLIANRWDDDKFEGWADMVNTDRWYSNQAMTPMLKLLGLSLNNEETDELFWLAYDNREGLRNGSLDSYLELKKRPLTTYNIKVNEIERKSVEYIFDVLIDAYSKSDALSEVVQNEDGEYHYWDWDTSESYRKEIYDSEIMERDVVEVKEIVESLVIEEQIKASPIENDIMSELKELVNEWSGCEEGMRVACKYKNQVQELIDRYKNKGLYEHRNNFTSHSYEPQIGDKVINTNPGCKHYKSEGVIEDIKDLPEDAGKTVTYVVSNNGKTYQQGDKLNKTLDQIEPMT